MAFTDRPHTQKMTALQKLETMTSKEYQTLGSPSSSNSPDRSTAHQFNKSLGLSYVQSSSTLQHSASAWGFSKSDRFPKIQANPENNFLKMPSTLNPRSTTFGYGSKGGLIDDATRRTITFPAPNKYMIKSDFQNKKAGRTFGLSYSAYAKIYVPGCTWMPPEIAKDYPGPGTYYTPRIPEPKRPRITLKPKGKMFNEDLCLDAPPVNKYHPVMSLVESARFRNTTFGFGNKLDFTKSPNSNPGPGTYKVVSCFDKIVSKKKKKKVISSRQRLITT